MFRTLADVDEYLSGDRVECLVCGRSFRNLTKHLQMLHSVDPREYRIQHGIPLSRGLVGATTRAMHANAALKHTEILEKMQAAGKSRGSAAGVAKRRAQGYVVVEAVRVQRLAALALGESARQAAIHHLTSEQQVLQCTRCGAAIRRSTFGLRIRRRSENRLCGSCLEAHSEKFFLEKEIKRRQRRTS